MIDPSVSLSIFPHRYFDRWHRNETAKLIGYERKTSALRSTAGLSEPIGKRIQSFGGAVVWWKVHQSHLLSDLFCPVRFLVSIFPCSFQFRLCIRALAVRVRCLLWHSREIDQTHALSLSFPSTSGPSRKKKRSLPALSLSLFLSRRSCCCSASTAARLCRRRTSTLPHILIRLDCVPSMRGAQHTHLNPYACLSMIFWRKKR